MERLISWARWEMLIKAVAQAIPSYAISIFSFTKDICNSIPSTINWFWWGTNLKIGSCIGWDIRNFVKGMLKVEWGLEIWMLLTELC